MLFFILILLSYNIIFF